MNILNRKKERNMLRVISILTAVFCATVASSAEAKCSHDQQVRALALNIYHEARNQGHDGMLMVAEVTINRVKNSNFPNTICGVVYQGRKDQSGNMLPNRCQFSWYCDGKSDRAINQTVWNDAVDIAEGILSGDVDLLNIGATHYLNPNTVSRMPKWTKKYELVGTWGDHRFYAMGDKL